MVHTTIIKDWFTQHCEDAPDLKGYKKFHLACQFLVKKSGKIKKFQAETFFSF